MQTDSLIHLRVPAATKARWVRDSRAAGRKLTDWIVHRVEAQAMEHKTNISIQHLAAAGALRRTCALTSATCMPSSSSATATHPATWPGIAGG